MYPHRKLDCTSPTDLAPHPLSAARGTPATLMMTRSALHSSSANAIRPTTINLLGLSGQGLGLGLRFKGEGLEFRDYGLRVGNQELRFTG